MIAHSRSFVVVSGLALLGALPSAHAQGVAALVPHRAVYNLELDNANEKAGIAAMYGRMVYELTGSQCEGYKVNFRFVTQVDNGSEKKTSDQQSVTFEDVQSGLFEFESRSYTDDRLDKEVVGRAEDRDDKIAVELTSPDPKNLDLLPSRFPTQHLLETLSRARKGEHFFEARLFDGSENGDKTLFTTTIVGSQVAPQPGVADTDKAGPLKGEKIWPVTIAYYNDGEKLDALPIYRMSFKLYDNGVSRDLLMDYGDFALKGQLVSLDLLPETKCE